MRNLTNAELAQILDKDIFHKISEAADGLSVECYVVGGYAVSYTHLDVYKRQGQYLVCILCIATSQYLHSLGYSHRRFYKSFTFRVFSQEL